jgi:hypothetical protein
MVQERLTKSFGSALADAEVLVGVHHRERDHRHTLIRGKAWAST